MTDQISTVMEASETPAPNARGKKSKNPATRAVKAKPQGKAASKGKAPARSAKAVAKPKTEPATTVAEGLNGPDPELMKSQSRVWNTLMDRYFRLDISGWENLPDQPSLLIGVHYPELAVWYHAAPDAIPAPTFA